MIQLFLGCSGTFSRVLPIILDISILLQSCSPNGSAASLVNAARVLDGPLLFFLRVFTSDGITNAMVFLESRILLLENIKLRYYTYKIKERKYKVVFHAEPKLVILFVYQVYRWLFCFLYFFVTWIDVPCNCAIGCT